MAINELRSITTFIKAAELGSLRQAARDMGFTGTPDELAYTFNRYMTEKNESLFGSDIIYQAIVSNNIDKLELEQIGKDYQANLEKDISRGERLLQLYRARQGRK